MKEETFVAICIVIMLVLFGLTSFLLDDNNGQPVTIEEAELSLYCEMVELRKTSQDQNLGWPDYKGIYEKECSQ